MLHTCANFGGLPVVGHLRVQSQASASLHNLKHFFTLFHSLPLHDSHLNTGLLIAKMQANLAWNKANKMVDKIQPYSYYSDLIQEDSLNFHELKGTDLWIVKHRFEVDQRKKNSALCATKRKKKKGNFSFAQDIQRRQTGVFFKNSSIISQDQFFIHFLYIFVMNYELLG